VPGERYALLRAKNLRRVTLSGRLAFWVAAAVSFLLFFAVAAPSPLCLVYQREWHFSATTLTAVFAVYALTLLVTLLFLGSLSDHVDRRRVIVAAIAVDMLACVSFLAAHGVGLLFAARALQGVAVGLCVSAIGATLIDLRPRGGLAPLISSAAATAGLAAGALTTSALAQYGPRPTALIWWLLLGGFALSIFAVLAMPDPMTTHPGALASIRPRVVVPREARAAFAIAVPCLVGVWALGGFYLSLGPSLVAQQLHSQNLLWGGVVIFLLSGIGAAASVPVRNADPAAVMLGGCLALFAGAAITFAAIATGTPAALLLGTAVAGLGFGPGFMGAYRIVVAVALPEDRAELVAAIFTVNYLAFSVPAVIAGLATSRYGLHATALVYAAAIALLAAAAAGSLLFWHRRSSGRPSSAAANPDPPPGPCTMPPYAPRERVRSPTRIDARRRR
jgi:predicted MFS family arabinose efflux permease